MSKALKHNSSSSPLLTTPSFQQASSGLSPINPTRTINTPLRLLTNILPTKLTLDLLLHNIIIRTPRIRQRNDPQRQRNTQKSYHFIQETAVRKHHRAVVQRLCDGRVAVGYSTVVVGTVFQDRELLVEVTAKEGQERDYG